MPGRCERCGAVIEPTARFCASCGTAVAPVPAAGQASPVTGWPAPPHGRPPQSGPTSGWQVPTAPVPPGPTRSGPPRRTRGKGRLVLLGLVVLALVGVALAVGDQAAPGNLVSGQETAIGGLIGERPIIKPGPDLGDAWTTAPDPATFLLIEDDTPVASDQYLVVFSDGTPASTAEAAAQAVGGSIAGHFGYVDTWKIQTAYAAADAETWHNQKALLEEQPGVVAVGAVALTTTAADPDCAPGLATSAYGGANAKPYEMIGVKGAWEAYYASGLPKSSVHLGMIDTVLTKDDPGAKLAWEFNDITVNGDLPTTDKLRPTTATDPRTDGFHHADGTLGIIAADASNGGITGIASPLGSDLVVSFAELNGSVDKGATKEWTSDDGLSYTDVNLLNTIHQIESGATIINGSWGATTVSSANAGDALMWKTFYTKMAEDHPEVLFVFAAGNQNGALDGRNYYPAGIPAPNVITVGNIDTDATRNSSSNGIDPTISGGEVSLGAPGNQAVWGRGADGKIRNEYGGTSSAAPMVTATAALVRAIDPTLSAAQVKDIITGSAAAGEAQVGGRQLRTDLAVRKAIDGARAKAKLPPLTDTMIAAAVNACSITVTGSITARLESPAGATEWSVQASLATAPGPTVLSLVAGGARPTNWRQPVGGPGVSATWKVLAPAAGVPIIVTRLDNGFWVKYTLRDDGRPTASPSAAPEASPEVTSKPTVRPKPTSTKDGHDCAHPPADLKPGTIAYLQWMLPCGAISP